MYSAMPSDVTTMPPSSIAHRTGEVVHLGEQVEHPLTMKPTVSVLMIVPMPARCLQRDPGEEHDEADEHDHDAEREAGDVGEALMEHVPRRDAELGVEDRGDADARGRGSRRAGAAGGARARGRSAT